MLGYELNLDSKHRHKVAAHSLPANSNPNPAPDTYHIFLIGIKKTRRMKMPEIA